MDLSPLVELQVCCLIFQPKHAGITQHWHTSRSRNVPECRSPIPEKELYSDRQYQYQKQQVHHDSGFSSAKFLVIVMLAYSYVIS